jgi:hypothetical protein
MTVKNGSKPAEALAQADQEWARLRAKLEHSEHDALLDEIREVDAKRKAAALAVIQEEFTAPMEDALSRYKAQGEAFEKLTAAIAEWNEATRELDHTRTLHNSAVRREGGRYGIPASDLPLIRRPYLAMGLTGRYRRVTDAAELIQKDIRAMRRPWKSRMPHRPWTAPGTMPSDARR